MQGHVEGRKTVFSSSSWAMSKRGPRTIWCGLRLSNVVWAACVCCLIATWFILSSDLFLHWFLAPIVICGILTVVDALDWFQGRVDTFDPIGLLGLIGFHFFFLAPLLHVSLGFWLYEAAIDPPHDWREWLGKMAALNVVGLLAYRLSRNILAPRQPQRIKFSYWKINRKSFLTLIFLSLLMTGGLQLFVYQEFGGIVGYVMSSVARVVPTGGMRAAGSMQGWGWVYAISEGFPVLAMLVTVVYVGDSKNRSKYRKWSYILGILCVYLVLKVFFGGLRGSRSNIIWALVWAAGMVHFWIRPIPRRTIMIGCLLIFLFTYFYGFYKGAGDRAVVAVHNREVRQEIIESTGRGLDSVLLGDLGRSDVQAYLLYRLESSNSNYQYAWGRTYFGAITSLVPRFIWPDRWPSKVKEGTEVLDGPGTYDPESFHLVRQYGLAGEAMLNFGLVGVPLAFLLFGLLIGYSRRCMASLRPGDSRLLLLPIVPICFCLLLIADSDNLLNFLLAQCLIPSLVLLFSSRRIIYRKRTGFNNQGHIEKPSHASSNREF